jgi:hypothetical protein
MPVRSTWDPSHVGLELARGAHRSFRRLADGTWFVPDGEHIFVVRTPRQCCSCHEFEQHLAWCVHLWAVAYVMSNVTLIDGTHFDLPAITEAGEWLISLALKVGS